MQFSKKIDRYHGGVIRLLKISSEITSLFNKESIIHEVYEGMNRFMKLTDLSGWQMSCTRRYNENTKRREHHKIL